MLCPFHQVEIRAAPGVGAPDQSTLIGLWRSAGIGKTRNAWLWLSEEES
jgi:hypothetical protein